MLFACGPPVRVGYGAFRSAKRQRRQPRGLAKPTGENNPSAQLGGFFCQNHENSLCDFLGLMRIASMSQRDRIDFVEVSLNQYGKSFFGTVLDVISQQNDVIQFSHHCISAAKSEKVTDFLGGKFCAFICKNVVHFLIGTKCSKPLTAVG